jgi:hypothetical protein
MVCDFPEDPENSFGAQSELYSVPGTTTELLFKEN